MILLPTQDQTLLSKSLLSMSSSKILLLTSFHSSILKSPVNKIILPLKKVLQLLNLWRSPINKHFHLLHLVQVGSSPLPSYLHVFQQESQANYNLISTPVRKGRPTVLLATANQVGEQGRNIRIVFVCWNADTRSSNRNYNHNKLRLIILIISWLMLFITCVPSAPTRQPPCCTRNHGINVTISRLPHTYRSTHPYYLSYLVITQIPCICIMKLPIFYHFLLPIQAKFRKTPFLRSTIKYRRQFCPGMRKNK